MEAGLRQGQRLATIGSHAASYDQPARHINPADKFTLPALRPSYRQQHGEAQRQQRRSPVSLIIMTAATTIASRILLLLALWLRLHAQLQQEHTHLRDLAALTRTLPDGSQFHERRSDGTSLTLILAVADTWPTVAGHG